MLNRNVCGLFGKVIHVGVSAAHMVILTVRVLINLLVTSTSSPALPKQKELQESTHRLDSSDLQHLLREAMKNRLEAAESHEARSYAGNLYLCTSLAWKHHYY